MPDEFPPRVPALCGYGAPENGHSVSGLSSGAFMALQLQIAHSSLFTGAGIIAGGPYRCADSFRGAAPLAADACMLSALYIAMSPLTPFVAPDPDALATLARRTAHIDPIANLAQHRIYLFSGTKDAVVSPRTVAGTEAFYRMLGVPDRQILFVDHVPAGHAILTDNPEDSPLGANRPPYINYSGDRARPARMQSHQLLAHIHPGSTQPTTSLIDGELLRFDQKPFLPKGTFERSSMNPFGYVYVPGAVLRGKAPAAVHVALHGCKQGFGYVNYVHGLPDVSNQAPYGNRFITTTGYNTFADANDFIVLYPQVTGDDLGAQNPDGCWDWWGYTQPDYYSQKAIQIAAIRGMLQQLSAPRAPRCGEQP
jgi:poly(3-hydroxybutyrate) depolymerase